MVGKSDRRVVWRALEIQQCEHQKGHGLKCQGCIAKSCVSRAASGLCDPEVKRTETSAREDNLWPVCEEMRSGQTRIFLLLIIPFCTAVCLRALVWLLNLCLQHGHSRWLNMPTGQREEIR